jgi:hypothetical protein
LNTIRFKKNNRIHNGEQDYQRSIKREKNNVPRENDPDYRTEALRLKGLPNTQCITWKRPRHIIMKF